MKPALISIAVILGLMAAFVLGTRYVPQQPPHSAPPPRSLVIDAVHDLNLQKTCAEGAAAYFKSGDNHPDSTHLFGYTNHYSAKLGKCLVLVEYNDFSNPGDPSTLVTIDDAFEGTNIASCLYGLDNVTKQIKMKLCMANMGTPGAKAFSTFPAWRDYSDGMMGS